MNKTELINSIALKSGLSKKNSEAALNAFISSVEESLQIGEKVVLVGFGTFEVRDRAERKGRNPQTGEEITIPASKAPVFRAGKGLKEKVK
ncbi:MAG TPA: HU family DNA-binding protein [Clostridiaceae bacterium]|jgi:DNA-binding protein HU-beta|nr:HU family DNA-binding protein [Clostridiaceae bacterium]